MILQATIFFIVGIIECFGVSLNTKLVQRNKYFPSFLTSFVNIVIWAYVISAIIENIDKGPYIVILYALGYGIGDVLGIKFDNYLEKLAKLKGLKIRKKKRCIRKRKKR